VWQFEGLLGLFERLLVQFDGQLEKFEGLLGQLEELLGQFEGLLGQLFPLIVVFMVGLGELQLHAKFADASFSRCTNIKGVPQNFWELL